MHVYKYRQVRLKTELLIPVFTVLRFPFPGFYRGGNLLRDENPLKRN